MGNGSVIVPGDVQRMSAGTGVRHSEFNPSRDRPVHFLQIWIEPDEQRHRADVRAEALRRRATSAASCALLAAPDGRDGAVTIHQDARVYAGLFDGDEAATLALAPGRRALGARRARQRVASTARRSARATRAMLEDEPRSAHRRRHATPRCWCSTCPDSDGRCCTIEQASLLRHDQDTDMKDKTVSRTADRHRHLEEGPRGDRRRAVAASRRQLHALPQDAQLPLERHRADVQHAAPHVRDAVQRAVARERPDRRAHPLARAIPRPAPTPST